MLYDIIDFTPKKFDIKKVGTQYRPTTKKAESDRMSIPTKNSISQSSNNVNTKNDENSKNKKYAVDYTIQDEKYYNIKSLDINKRSWVRRRALRCQRQEELAHKPQLRQ